MGDRAMVKIKDNEGGVYLYTHWRGSELADVVQTALARKIRWDDSEYLARIVFDAMTAGHQGEETGYGIASGPHSDLEHPLIVLNTQDGRVYLHPVSTGEPDETTIIGECTMEDACNGRLTALYQEED